MAFLYRVAWDAVAFSSCLWTTALELVFELTLFRSWNHPFGTSHLTSHFTDEKTKVHWGEVTCCRSDSYEIEPRMKVFAHGVEGFSCTGTSGSLAKHRHSRRGCQQPALKEARGPGILSFELHLKKIWGLQRSVVPCDSWYPRFPGHSWVCPTPTDVLPLSNLYPSRQCHRRA